MLQLEQNFGLDQFLHVDWHTSQAYRVQDTSARAASYGVGGVPHVVFDGINPVIGGGQDMYPTYLPIFQSHRAAQSQLLVDTDVTWDLVNEEGTVSVRVEVAAGETIADPGNKRVRAIVYVENHHHPVYGDWHALSLQMPLDAPLTVSGAGEVQVVPLTFAMDVASWAHASTVTAWTENPIDWSELRVVGFVQDEVTREILQSGMGLQPYDLEVTTLGIPVQRVDGGAPAEVAAEVAYTGQTGSDVAVSVDKSGLPAGWDAEVVWNSTTYSTGFTIPAMTDGQVEPILVRTLPGAGSGFGVVVVGAAPSAAPGWLKTSTMSTFHETPAILYVDDDQGAAYESYYLDAIAGSGLYAIDHDVKALAAPDAAYLAGFDAVVWSTGYPQSSTVTSADQTALISYLDQGGALFLSSHGIMNQYGATGSFITSYLDVASFLQDTQAPTITGVGGDVLGDGVSYSNSPPFVDLADTVTPGAGGVAWLNGPSGAVGVRHDGGTYRTVFMSTAFEGVPTPAERDLLMGRILGWLVPGGTVDAPDVPPSAATLRLAQNVPNPFVASTRLAFTVPNAGPVRLTVHDVAGRRIAGLVDRVMPAGRHDVTWSGVDDRGRRVASGVYLLRLEASGEVQTREMVRLR